MSLDTAQQGARRQGKTDDRQRDSSLDGLLQRILGEYLEMPGLCLTRSQAQRLWGLDEPSCIRLLDYLVELRFLVCRDGREYARLTEGRHPIALLMAQADLADRSTDRVATA